jgi:adenine-specific DNA-methyltransferase
MPTLNFKGKSFVQNHHLAVKYHQLVPQKDKSLTDKISLHDNLIIQGDNLKALKALLPTYAGKINCIYIDPPYNTGNEGWAYNDNVNSPMIKEWFGQIVDKDDLSRHDKWLCMMMPRLKLLKELLSEDGAIFISCDDNEQHNLRCLLDEIFGENNFVANIIWQHSIQGKNDVKDVSLHHNYTLIYQKSLFELDRIERTEEHNKNYSNPDNDPNGLWRSGDVRRETRESRPALYYPLISPDKTEIFPKLRDGGDGAWRWSKDKVEKEKNRIEWIQGKNGWTPYFRIYADTSKGRPPMTIWYNKEVGSNRTSKNEVNELFNDTNIFATPKPVKLIKRIINISCTENDIILDSFAGSGTTAHAVLDLNKEDEGNRKFILVEMEDYANSITAERVRRVINGVPKSRNFQEGTGGSFSYFELGAPIEMESILKGVNLPSYEEFAKYLFYTATGEEFDEKVVSNKFKSGNSISEDDNFRFIGESKDFLVYLMYKPDLDYLKSTALTLDKAKALGQQNGKKRLVFAPAKFVDNHTLTDLRIEFCQLPFEIYKLKS